MATIGYRNLAIDTPNGPIRFNAWSQGFQNKAGSRVYVNYGSADGCSTTSTTGCSGGWTHADYWNITAARSSARGLPQIYSTSQAGQWMLISAQGTPGITFLGSLTQRAACEDEAAGSPPDDLTCEITRNGSGQVVSIGTNTAAEGWQKLKDAINGAQTFGYATDIKHSVGP